MSPKGVHARASDDGDHQSVEAHREGDMVFAGNQQTGEVATRAGGWVDFYTLKKGPAKKLVDEFVRCAVELWVESAGVPEHVEKIVDKRLPGIVDKAIAAKVEKVAAEILEKMLREKLAAHLHGALDFEFDVRVKRLSGAL